MEETCLSSPIGLRLSLLIPVIQEVGLSIVTIERHHLTGKDLKTEINMKCDIHKRGILLVSVLCRNRALISHQFLLAAGLRFYNPD